MSCHLLTTSEVADELKISIESARQLMTSGKLRFVQVGLGTERFTRRVRRDTLDEFKSREVSGVDVANEIARATAAASVGERVDERW